MEGNMGTSDYIDYAIIAIGVITLGVIAYNIYQEMQRDKLFATATPEELVAAGYDDLPCAGCGDTVTEFDMSEVLT